MFTTRNASGRQLAAEAGGKRRRRRVPSPTASRMSAQQSTLCGVLVLPARRTRGLRSAALLFRCSTMMPTDGVCSQPRFELELSSQLRTCNGSAQAPCAVAVLHGGHCCAGSELDLPTLP